MKILFLSQGYENLGIECLSAALKSAGFETELEIDPSLFKETGFVRNNVLGQIFELRDQILARIISRRPDLVCFSVLTDNYAWAIEWARKIKEYLGVPVVFGGIHPTSMPELVIGEKSVNYVCVGEGDEAVVKLALAIKGAGDVIGIPGIWAKKGEKIYKNNVHPPVENLDKLPFPDKALFYEKYPFFKSGYLISSSRGCPFACAYCCNNVYHSIYRGMNYLRRRSPDNVISELALAKKKYHPQFVHFSDEVFNLNDKWLKEFLLKYKTEVGLPFACYIYPDLVSRSQAAELKAAGCFKVQMGIQVADDAKRREVLNRPSTLKNIGAVIDMFKAEKIYVVCDNILGFPDETEEELAALCAFYAKHTPDRNELFFLGFYPKSPITNWAVLNGYIDKGTKRRIEAGTYSSGIVSPSEVVRLNSFSRQFMFLLGMIPIIPKRVSKIILARRLYVFFPVFPNALLRIGIRLLNHPAYDMFTAQFVKRYWYFMLKFISYAFERRKSWV